MKYQSTIGIDLGDKTNCYCEIDHSGKVIDQGSVVNRPEPMKVFMREHSESVLVVETGPQTGWVVDLSRDLGVKMIVANSRKTASIWKSRNKSDRHDAQELARLARADESLLSPVTMRQRKSRLDLVVIKAREALVEQRTHLVNAMRAMSKNFGYFLKTTSAKCFENQIDIPQELKKSLEGLVKVVKALNVQIKRYDRAIETMGKNYPETQKLRKIKGVGPITSLAYVLLLEDHRKFNKSRDVGAYLGLKPRRDQSGEMDKQLGISKVGSALLRRLLVNCSQYILARGEDSELKRFGQKLAKRGGRAAMKKAVIAVARKLAVLLHALWKSDEPYQALKTQAS